jgi:hypothetical protein
MELSPTLVSLRKIFNSTNRLRRELPRCCANGPWEPREHAKAADESLTLLDGLIREEELRCYAPVIDAVWFDLDGIIFKWRERILEVYPEFKNIDEFNKHPDKDEMVSEAYRKNPGYFTELEEHEGALGAIQTALVMGLKVGFLTATGEFQDPAITREHKRIALANYILRHRLPTELLDNINFVVHSVDKQKHAKPNIILVDDFKKNHEEWRRAGGASIHVDTEFKSESAAWLSFYQDMHIVQEAQNA